MTTETETRNGRTEFDIVTRAGIAVTLGGREYGLRPRSIASNRQWKARVQAGLGDKFTTLGEVTGLDDFYGFMSGSGDVLLDLLTDYDETHVLPSREEIEEVASDHEVLEAFMVLLEQAFPFFEIGRRFLPAEMRGIIIGRLMVAVLQQASAPSTNTPSQPGATTIRPRSKKR